MTPKLPPDIEAAIDDAVEYDLSDEAIAALVDDVADEIEAEASRAGSQPEPYSGS
jgi:hypothetical protein